MADASVLVGGQLVRITHFDDMLYNHRDGFLVRFRTKIKTEMKTFIHVTKVNFRVEDADTIATAGYFEEQAILKYRVKQIKSEDILSFQLQFSILEKGIIGDKIIVQKLKVVSPFNDFCKVNRYTWIYDGSPISNINGIIIPPGPGTTITSENIPIHPVATAFYQRNIGFVNLLPANQITRGAYLLALSAIKIDNIQRRVFNFLSEDSSLASYIQEQNINWQFNDAFLNPSITDFEQYFANLTAFYNITYANQIAIKEAKSKTKLYWLSYILSIEALSIISVSLKIDTLFYIAEGTIIEGSALLELARFSPILGLLITPVINEEEMVLKIVKSVLGAPAQIDEFLGRLIALYDAGNGQTLFEILYTKVNDFGGNENLKVMMNSLYRLWAASSFYPYNIDGSVKSNLINNTIYANKPIDIGYTSERVAFFFNASNYDFVFNKQVILAYNNEKLTIDEESNFQPSLFGEYDFYQSISINKKESDLGTSTFTFIEITNANNQVEQLSVLPVFYLKYLDDKRSTENLVTGISLSVDIILTLTGIGNLSKLRHIRSVYKLGRVALGLDAIVAGDVLASIEFARGVIGVVEITGSIGNIFIQYGNQLPMYCTVGASTYDQQKCEFYTKLNNLFLALQIIAPTLDLATSKLVSNSARRILEGPIPSDFNPDALNILRKFAGDIIELKEIFRVRLAQRFGNNSSIWTKLNTLDTFKQEEFIMDFGKVENNVLDALHTDSELIEDWGRINYLKGQRTNIDYLKAYKYVKNPNVFNKLRRIEEINGKWVGGHLGKDLFDNTNPIYAVLDQTADVSEFIYGLRTYKQVKKTSFSMYSGLVTKRKKGWHTWIVGISESEFLEEIAYAMSKKKKVNVQKSITTYKSYFSDGCSVTLKIENPVLLNGINYNNHLTAVILNPK